VGDVERGHNRTHLVGYRRKAAEHPVVEEGGVSMTTVVGKGGFDPQVLDTLRTGWGDAVVAPRLG